MSQCFSFDEILLATQNFDDSLVSASGDYGKVYKGQITNRSNTNVAIKRLNPMADHGIGLFWLKIEVFSKMQNRNLVSLIGYHNNDSQQMVLLYEYMPHGSLEYHIHKAETRLPWLQRLKVCVGAARGLKYLHDGTGATRGVIHRDVKSSNILLDVDFVAKISDFRLAEIRQINQKLGHESDEVKGTVGYMDPYYYQTGKLTRKSDVYAFGVVLFEVLCGRPAIDLNEDQWVLALWAQERIKEGKLIEMADARMRGQIISFESVKEFARIAVKCADARPNRRPSMAKVVASLGHALSVQEKMGSVLADKAPSIDEPDEEVDVDQLVNAEVGVQLRDKSVYSQIFHFDNGSLFSADEILSSEAQLIVKSNHWSSYRIMLSDGNKVVIKRRTNGEFKKEFEREISVFGKIRHQNVLPLKAYCYKGDEDVFISEDIQMGNVASIIDFSEGCRPEIGWSTRMKIIVGIVKGLVYLHNHLNIVHGNLTLNNILIDKNYNPLIADVGHPRLIANAMIPMIRDRAPELFRFENANKETDVYSLGLIMLQLLTKKPSQSIIDRCHLPKWAVSLVKRKEKPSVEKELVRVWQLARACVGQSPESRPKARAVLRQVEESVARAAYDD